MMGIQSDSHVNFQHRRIWIEIYNRGNLQHPVDHEHQKKIPALCPLECVEIVDHPENEGEKVLGVTQYGNRNRGEEHGHGNWSTAMLRNGHQIIEPGKLGQAWINLYRLDAGFIGRIDTDQYKNKMRFPAAMTESEGSSSAHGQTFACFQMMETSQGYHGDRIEGENYTSSSQYSIGVWQTPLLYKASISSSANNASPNMVSERANILASGDSFPDLVDLGDGTKKVVSTAGRPGYAPVPPTKQNWIDNDLPIPAGQCFMICHGRTQGPSGKVVALYAGGACGLYPGENTPE